MSKIKICIKRF